ncbi:MAG: hypothetical protein MUF29_05275 [Chitinophagaceae bacterium]|jgi:hypothetical protein|nr:hypothetical protein [Chitinophagaceae bacterium]
MSQLPPNEEDRLITFTLAKSTTFTQKGIYPTLARKLNAATTVTKMYKILQATPTDIPAR